jgi:hypothetical protein
MEEIMTGKQDTINKNLEYFQETAMQITTFLRTRNAKDTFYSGFFEKKEFTNEDVHEFYHDLKVFKENNPKVYKENKVFFDSTLMNISSYTRPDVVLAIEGSIVGEDQYKIVKEFEDARKNLEKLLKKEPKKVAKAIYEAPSNLLITPKEEHDDASNKLMQTMLSAVSCELTHKIALISERIDVLEKKAEGEGKAKQPKTFKQKLKSFCKAIVRLFTKKHIVKDEDLQKAFEDFSKLEKLKEKYNLGKNETSEKSKKIYGPFTEGLVSTSKKSKPGNSKGNNLGS